jgi:hypothetical protein
MTEETTGNVRGIAGWGFWLGAAGCFTPLLPMGAALATIGGIVWLLAPANAGRTQQMVDERQAGGGCWAGLGAVLFAVVVMLLAGLLAAGAGVAMVGGGL